MIDFYYWPTPNGHKVSIMFEETGLEHRVVPVDIGAGDQFKPEFLKISPNNRMPAIVDRETGISLFEGGAILVYLADKSECLLPKDGPEHRAARCRVLSWLFWQAAGLGPMAGQLSHYRSYLEEPVPYAEQRYANEYERLLAVMDVELEHREFIAGDYSIADIAAFPWVRPYQRLGKDIDDFPSLKRWYETLEDRPAVRRGIDLGRDWPRGTASTKEAKAMLFQQNAETVRQSRRQETAP